jgi:2'-5' RNA ligase
VGVPLLAPSRETLGQRLAPLRTRYPRVRWANPQQWHLTLRFLGATRPDDLPGIEAALRRVGRDHPAFTVELRQAGGFHASAGATVWLGFGPADQQALSGLAATVAGQLPDASADVGSPPFRPHLTVCRHAPPTLRTELAELVADEPVGWRVDRMRLVRSFLEAAGARHVTLLEVPLDGA